MRYAVQPPEVMAVPVAGTDASFPVRRIYCVGRNYLGDLIYTGTPAGVAPVVRGDKLLGQVDRLSDLEITIGARR